MRRRLLAGLELRKLQELRIRLGEEPPMRILELRWLLSSHLTLSGLTAPVPRWPIQIHSELHQVASMKDNRRR